MLWESSSVAIVGVPAGRLHSDGRQSLETPKVVPEIIAM
jgi:hypothetical protein